MALIAEDRLAQSQAMADYYNDALAGGKWDGFQTQPYLGYSGWQQPQEENGSALSDFIYPYLETVAVPAGADMGVAIDGTDVYWPEATIAPVLPTFSPYQVQSAQYIEVFNRGTDAFDYEITVAPDAPWLTITPSQGTIDDITKEVRAVLTVNDWSAVPKGTTTLTITVSDVTDFASVNVEGIIENPDHPPAAGAFVESNGYVAMEADHYSRLVDASPITWQRIPDIGRTGSGMTPFPVTAARVTPGGESARLEYDMHLYTTGEVTVTAYLSPRQNVFSTDGLTFALSIDDGAIQNINITEELDPLPFPDGKRGWERGVADNVHRVFATFDIAEAGPHVLKLWAVDPTVIVQKLVVGLGGMPESYLGPPESFVAGSADKQTLPSPNSPR